MNFSLREKIRTVPKYIWILLAIIFVGVFLRTYHFHDWLEFKGDQARDAELVSNVINGRSSWPLLGATMNGSAEITDKQFRIGPFYYYFQIISGKIFGDYPDKFAYPDLLFSILSIPLFFFFLRKYFSRENALLLSGLYAISFFAVHPARFAWNSNSIPFFILLLLISLYEFRRKEESVSWVYVVTLGVAWGVGFQLHAISMVLFSFVCLYFFLSSFIKNPIIWRKWFVVFSIFFVLNLGQIVSEVRNDFSNTRTFFQFFAGGNDKGEKKISFLTKISHDIDCHIQANFYIISSLDENNCSFYSAQILTNDRTKDFLKKIKNPFFEIGLAIGTLFSVFGYTMLISRYKKEQEEGKRIFLQIVLVSIVLSFLVMIPVVKGNAELRYFNIVFFVPFILLGLLKEYSDTHFLKFTKNIFLIIILLAGISNFSTLFHIGHIYAQGKAVSGTHQVVLGEIEPLVRYMIMNANGRKTLFVDARYDLAAFIFDPLKYFLKREGITLIRVSSENRSSISSLGNGVFYLSYKSPPGEDRESGLIYINQVKN